MHISMVETPAIVVDLDILERNIERVASYAREHHLRVRPHTKTHKSPLIGRMQLEAGAAGLTVAKVGEAEVMLGSGTPDLLVAYPVIGETKLRRLMDVAMRTSVTVALDSEEAASALSGAAVSSNVSVGVLVEEDVGLGRTGLHDVSSLVNLARKVHAMPGLRLAGFNFYPGHLKRMDEDGLVHLRRLGALLEETADCWNRAGLPLEIVSGGSTPTLFHSHLLAALTVNQTKVKFKLVMVFSQFQHKRFFSKEIFSQHIMS